MTLATSRLLTLINVEKDEFSSWCRFYKTFLNKLERFLSKFYLQEQGLAQSFVPKNTLAYFAAASMT